MSAGVIIMNKNAVALAADSAVTIGNHLAIHNSANKVFALSKVAPVGVITYANATFMNIPIEVIIKQYKHDLGCKRFDSLSDYVDGFLSYLTQHQTLFHFDQKEHDSVFQILENLFEGLKGDTEDLLKKAVFKKKRVLNAAELTEVYKNALELTKKYVKEMPFLQNPVISDYIKEKYGNEIAEFLKKSFKYYSDEDIHQMLQISCEVFDKAFTRNGVVGLAFTGYGENEIFPSVIHINMLTIINNQVRYFIVNKSEINDQQHASIIPLAQDDVMRNFLTGIHDGFERNIITEVNAKLATHINQMYGNKVPEAIKAALFNSLQTVISTSIASAVQKQSSSYFLPMYNSVGTLPIEELALVAESMINITSLRRRVALDNNIGTVGGPVDVAVITKADGLIWIRRKHFFDRKYNPQYFYSHYMLNENLEEQYEKNRDE